MQLQRYIALFILLIGLQPFFAQTKVLDSLKILLNASLHDCNRADILYQIGREQQENNRNELAIRYGKQSLDLSINLSCEKNMFHCYNLLGIAFDDNGNYPEAKKFFQAGLDLAIKLKDAENMSIFYTNLGETYRSMVEYSKALDCFLKGLKIDEQKKDEDRMVSDYFTLALLFGNLDEAAQQKKYLFNALALSKKTKNKRVEAKCYNIYANLLGDEDKNDSALYYYNKSLTLAKSIDLKHLQAKVLSNIGGVYRDKNDYVNAIAYSNRSVAINTEIGDYKFLAADYISLGWIYSEVNDLEQSKNYFVKAYELSKGRFFDSEIHAYKGLAFLSAKKKNYEAAFDYHVKYTEKKDSVYNEENSKALGDIRTNYEVEKKESELKAEQEKIQAVAFEEKKQQKIIIASVVGFLLVVLVFSFFLYKRFKITEKQKKIIALKSQETERQKSLVEEKQKEIIDSIRYAQRIQNAILPQVNDLKKHLPNNFVLYKPKDIIAGDFYWMYVSEKPELVFIAAADSTGHGVPGTIVSIVCSNALDKAVKEFNLIDTGKILDKTTELVLETFAKSGEEISDGMDISLLCIDRKGRKITWSGANNQLLYISPAGDGTDGNILHQIKPNKQPIGKSENRIPFKTHEIVYDEGALFYLMTDGYQDQFGGKDGKKFKYKKLENLIMANCSLPLKEQEKALNEAFIEWKGELEQVDDVTVIGIQL